MKRRVPPVPLVLSSVALFASVGGGAALAADGWSASKQQVKQLIAVSTANNANHLGGHDPSAYLRAKHLASSGGVRFIGLGQTVTLGRTGHFTFTASCSNASGGKDSDADNSTPDNPLNAGDFTQVGSASSSTEIAADGQEVDVFYNDGVNWPATGDSPPHACFAGYTGFAG